MNLQLLKGHLPPVVFEFVKAVATPYGIDSDLKAAHFLAQCDYESAGWRYTQENLNYSAAGLLATFPKYFTAITAKQYEHRPEAIANHVYANRIGNGDEASGDGWKYRGRGYIQLTGKTNYQTYSAAVGVDVVASPDLISSQFPMDSAAYFFKNNKLFAKSNEGATFEVCAAITKRVNGSDRTAPERFTRFLTYFGILHPKPQTYHITNAKGKKLATISSKKKK